MIKSFGIFVSDVRDFIQRDNQLLNEILDIYNQLYGYVKSLEEFLEGLID
jgi:hypothetical protein